MAVWELSPAENKKLIISLDADTREAAINKVKEKYPEYKGWITAKVGYSDTEEKKPEEREVISTKEEGAKTKANEKRGKKTGEPKAVKKGKKKKGEIIILDL